MLLNESLILLPPPLLVFTHSICFSITIRKARHQRLDTLPGTFKSQSNSILLENFRLDSCPSTNNSFSHFLRADLYLLFTDVRVGLLSYGRRYGQVCGYPVFLCYETASRALILLSKVKMFILKSANLRSFLCIQF